MTLTTTNVHSHVVAAECPVPCLEGLLPSRALNALIHELRPSAHAHGTVADVVRLQRTQRLGEIRGIGVSGVVHVEAVLMAAGLIENTEQNSGYTQN